MCRCLSALGRVSDQRALIACVSLGPGLDRLGQAKLLKLACLFHTECAFELADHFRLLICICVVLYWVSVTDSLFKLIFPIQVLRSR